MRKVYLEMLNRMNDKLTTLEMRNTSLEEMLKDTRERMGALSERLYRMEEQFIEQIKHLEFATTDTRTTVGQIIDRLYKDEPQN